MNQTRLFIAYSRKDAKLLDELKMYLKPTIRKYNLKVWDDKEIDAGATWEQEIKNNLNSADIFLFLITANSLASDYFHNKELAHAIERHKKGEVNIIPIIMQPCDWTSSPFAEIQVLPQDGKPVFSSDWKYPPEAYSNIVNGIKKVLKQREVKRNNQLQEEKQKQQEIAAAKKAKKLKKEQEKLRIKEEQEKKQKIDAANKQIKDIANQAKTKNPFNIKTPTTPNLNFKAPNISTKKSTPPLNQLEKEDILMEKGAVILERGFYAALPIIGYFLIAFSVNKFEIQTFSDSFIPIFAIIGIVIFFIFQLIVVVDEYSYIELKSEVSETIWGVVLTIISCGLISGLGIFILNLIFSNI